MKIYKGCLLLGLWLFSACNTPAQSSAPTPVLASTTFLADIAQHVAGERLQVGSLLPTGVDPHSYQPIPKDLARLSKSKLLILNGAGYEHFLEPLLAETQGQATVVIASNGLSPRLGPDGAATDEVDPHFWLDPNNVLQYVENIRAALTNYDPAGAWEYQANANAYSAQLRQLDAWIKNETQQIAAEKRILITNHEALGYFADRYGFKIVGTVLPGVSAETSPAALQLTALIDLIHASQPPVIFLDTAENAGLAEQIAGETDAKVVGDLQLESLTAGPLAATYLDMMHYNVSRISAALK